MKNEISLTEVVAEATTSTNNFDRILSECQNGVIHTDRTSKGESLSYRLNKELNQYVSRNKGGRYEIDCFEKTLIGKLQGFAEREGLVAYGHQFITELANIDSFAKVVATYGFDAKQQKTFVRFASGFYNSFDAISEDNFLFADTLSIGQLYEVVRAVCASFGSVEVDKLSQATINKVEVKLTAKNNELLRIAESLKTSVASVTEIETPANG